MCTHTSGVFLLWRRSRWRSWSKAKNSSRYIRSGSTTSTLLSISPISTISNIIWSTLHPKWTIILVISSRTILQPVWTRISSQPILNKMYTWIIKIWIGWKLKLLQVTYHQKVRRMHITQINYRNLKIILIFGIVTGYIDKELIGGKVPSETDSINNILSNKYTILENNISGIWDVTVITKLFQIVFTRRKVQDHYFLKNTIIKILMHSTKIRR